MGKHCSLKEMRFAYPKPGHASSYEDIFQCPLVFNSEHHSISPRTLRRRLTEVGTSYKDLVSGIQKNKAITLLQKTSLSIGQIAAETGYNDLPNFYRAFKHWTGKTPGSYRAKTP